MLPALKKWICILVYCILAKLAVMTLLLLLQGELHIVVGPVGAGKVM